MLLKDWLPHWDECFLEGEVRMVSSLEGLNNPENVDSNLFSSSSSS